MLWRPVDVPAAQRGGAALHELEQAVSRADIPSAIGLEDQGRPRPADAGIDDAEKYGSRRKPWGIGRQEVGGRLGIAHRCVGEQVDNGRAGRHPVQHRLHLTRVGAVQTEIREDCDHRSPAIRLRRSANAMAPTRPGETEGQRGAGGRPRGRPLFPFHHLRPTEAAYDEVTNSLELSSAGGLWSEEMSRSAWTCP